MTIRAFLDEWVLKPEYLTAWLQAGAAIVALCISVWAVWWAGAGARRRERQEIRALAVAVYPEIEMLKASTQNVRTRIAEIKNRYSNLMGQSVAATLQLSTHIQMPPMIERNIDKLFILGDIAGPSCVHLVRLLIKYNDTVEQIVARVTHLNAEQWITAVGHLEEHLALLDKVIDKCEHEVRSIHNRILG